jgi:peptide/nickel transport system substrate-binding protein
VLRRAARRQRAEDGAKARRRYGDTLIEASIGNVSSLIPNITSDAASHEVGDFMYNGLVALGRDLEIGRTWPSRGVQQGLPHARLPAHEGVKWHDGVPFTADDVVFTWQSHDQPRTPSPYKSDFNDVENGWRRRGPRRARHLQEAVRQGAHVVGRR